MMTHNTRFKCYVTNINFIQYRIIKANKNIGIIIKLKYSSSGIIAKHIIAIFLKIKCGKDFSLVRKQRFPTQFSVQENVTYQ